MLENGAPSGIVPVTCVLFRQRPKGSFDGLQLTRTKFTRKIFIRHALPNMRRWASPLGVLRSYYKAVSTYAVYFIDTAAERIASGDRVGALRAVAAAFWVSPIHVARDLLRPTSPLRAGHARKNARS